MGTSQEVYVGDVGSKNATLGERRLVPNGTSITQVTARSQQS